ncbi:MAG: aldo/keto reductase [Oscillospiraceae bacterium]|nr:aldo/keto reductase [Oscillospiraceae bacterium]
MGVKQVKLEKLGIEVSRLGFGCMRLPRLDNGKGKIDREKAARMLDMAYAAGVNYFDTAYIYHGGESQIFLGEHMKKYPRESFHLATKLPIWQCETLEDAIGKYQEQVRDCNLGYFDFYLLHSMDQERLSLIRRIGIYDYLVAEKKAGRIKYLGFSHHGNYESFKELLTCFEWDFAQIQINYADDVMGSMRKYYDLTCELGIPCFVMEPVRGGGLSVLPPEAAQIIGEFEQSGGAKISQAGWALRWCMDKDNLKVILSGMTQPEQVEDNIRTFSDFPDKLTESESAMINRLRDVFLANIKIPCTCCYYCMDCPVGVEIPQVFRTYNQYKVFGNPYRALEEYGCLLSEKSDGGQCVACGQCMEHCPQSINIPEGLKEAHAVMSTIVRPAQWKFPGAV